MLKQDESTLPAEDTNNSICLRGCPLLYIFIECLLAHPAAILEIHQPLQILSFFSIQANYGPFFYSQKRVHSGITDLVTNDTDCISMLGSLIDANDTD